MTLGRRTFPSTSIENFELQLLEVLFISEFDQDGVI